MKAEAVNQLVVGSSPTGGATAKPATLLAVPEEFEAILAMRADVATFFVVNSRKQVCLDHRVDDRKIAIEQASVVCVLL